jgi:hypothetical protein
MFRSQNPLLAPPLLSTRFCSPAPYVKSVLGTTRALANTDPYTPDTQLRTQPLFAQAILNAFRHTGGVLPPELETDSCFSLLSSLVAQLPQIPRAHSPLNPVESALPQNAPITRLESALPKSKRLKPFRIRTYEKTGGRGYSLLSVNCTLPPPATWPDHCGAMRHA